MARCVSWAGIHDMTGNVDEWTVNESGTPYQSALKGGWWGHIRARCRPATTSHNEGFVYYQIGFRCCADPRPAGEAPAAVSSPFAPRPNIRLPANPYRRHRR
jgi:sulfatase modifying factor 1